MANILGKFTDPIYGLTRLVIGFTYACHGAQKLFGVLGSQPHREGLFLAAGIIEFVAGVMVALGLQASIAAFVASGEMAVAYFMMHAPRGFWPIKNMGELAVAYCFFFLFVAADGSGRYSVDGLLGRKSSGS